MGVNAVIVSEISQPGTTWAEILAKKISDKNTHSNLAPGLLE